MAKVFKKYSPHQKAFIKLFPTATTSKLNPQRISQSPKEKAALGKMPKTSFLSHENNNLVDFKTSLQPEDWQDEVTSLAIILILGNQRRNSRPCVQLEYSA